MQDTSISQYDLWCYLWIVCYAFKMKAFFTQLNIVFCAIKTVLAKWTYQIAFLILLILFVALYISIPVLIVPGNTLTFQLSLYTFADYAIFVSISVLTSLLVLMQVFSFLNSRKHNARAIGHGSVGIFSGILSGMFASITCVPCAIGFLGIFGSVGTTLIISKYQYYFVTVAILFVLLGIYYASRRVMGYCKECDISNI